MTDFSRRYFLKVLGVAGGVGVGTAVVAGCGGGDTVEQPVASPEAEPMAEGFSCMDTEGLTETEMLTRTTTEYTDTSTEEGKNCLNCVLYVAAESGSGCGTCLTVKGPIHPEGYCNIWAAITS